METLIRKEKNYVPTTDPNYANNFRFLRFNTVFLIYKRNSQSIDEKLHIQNQLQLFKTAFSDLKEINLSAKINQNDQSQFRNHFQLLDHIREHLLPICNSSSVYILHIDSQSDNDAAGNFIGQILQLLPINRCQNVYFHYDNETFIQFPVEIISNWLNRNSNDEIGCIGIGTGQSNKMRMLQMNSRIKIQNTVEMCDRFKMVRTFFKKYFKIPKEWRVRNAIKKVTELNFTYVIIPSLLVRNSKAF